MGWIMMYEHETRLLAAGYQSIAGCDEVGRGPLAGPVVCAAVILDPGHTIEGLDDSKKLTPAKRLRLDARIRQAARAYAVVFITATDVDDMNVYQASRHGMMLALDQLDTPPDYVLSDAMPLKLNCPSLSLIKGDQISATIAAASILAKVARDAYMVELGKQYPEYGFERHKGYPTPEHLSALKQFGPIPEHRRSFAPVAEASERQGRFNL
ncbi:MAG: ribonuclease HII [Acholeplasmatales bacterium]|nr:MAG: ribonuclease HII [Acholeplasmatales bacterium]